LTKLVKKVCDNTNFLRVKNHLGWRQRKHVASAGEWQKGCRLHDEKKRTV